jgi:hypothetical protein
MANDQSRAVKAKNEATREAWIDGYLAALRHRGIYITRDDARKRYEMEMIGRA